MTTLKGFKGTSIHISKVQVAGKALGAVVSFDIQFTDGEGIVHGIMHHDVDVNADPKIKEAAQSLLSALVSWSETVHYDTPRAASQTKELSRGIAEALSRPVDDPEGYEKQG